MIGCVNRVDLRKCGMGFMINRAYDVRGHVLMAYVDGTKPESE